MQMVDLCTIAMAQYNTALQLVLRLKKLVRTRQKQYALVTFLESFYCCCVVFIVLHPYSVYAIIPDLIRSTLYVH